MPAFVLDCSLALSWYIQDECNAKTRVALDVLDRETALVPSIWPLEILNALLAAERKQRMKPAESTTILHTLFRLPIEVDQRNTVSRIFAIQTLARTHGLTSYDASYLSLALDEGVPLATLDRKLHTVAEQLNIAYF